MLKVQQLLHICSEHYEAKEKEKEEDKDKKDKKDKDKKETAADMGSHQVRTDLQWLSSYISYFDLSSCFPVGRERRVLIILFTPSGCGCSWYCPDCHGRGDWL